MWWHTTLCLLDYVGAGDLGNVVDLAFSDAFCSCNTVIPLHAFTRTGPAFVRRLRTLQVSLTLVWHPESRMLFIPSALPQTARSVWMVIRDRCGAGGRGGVAAVGSRVGDHGYCHGGSL